MTACAPPAMAPETIDTARGCDRRLSSKADASEYDDHRTVPSRAFTANGGIK